MEEAFLQFEVEVMKLGYLKDVVDRVPVIVQICLGRDSNVVHVDPNSCAKGFMFEDDVTVDVVHHGLEGRWRIGESEIHDRGFEKSISGFERCFLLVSLANAYIVVPPSNIELHIDVCIAEIVDKICDQGKGVLVSNGDSVDLSVVLYRSHFTVLFADKEE